MPGPAYALVDILCDPAKLGQLAAIPNLVIDVRPIRTKDPAVVRVSVRADAAAQAAAQALGCTVTVVKSAEEYRAQIEDAYRDLGKDGGGSGPS
jgi:hypothetical protein